MVDAVVLDDTSPDGALELGDNIDAPDGSVNIAEIVFTLVDYIFSQAFVVDEENLAAFVDAFRENGRYRRNGDGDLTILEKDCDKATAVEPDYLALHEVYAALFALSESDRIVAFQCLCTQLLARQAAEPRA